MSKRRHLLILYAAAHDQTFTYNAHGDELWHGRCIHCKRQLALSRFGKPRGGATLEHIVPKHHGGTDALDNLAIACSRCNGQKGRKIDILQRTDPRLMKVIKTLKDRRLERRRPPPEDLPSDIHRAIQLVRERDEH